MNEEVEKIQCCLFRDLSQAPVPSCSSSIRFRYLELCFFFDCIEREYGVVKNTNFITLFYAIFLQPFFF